MKRYNNIFPKIVEMDNLRLAYRNARKGKSYYEEVKIIDKNPDYYLEQIQQMLISGNYKTSEYVIFKKNDKGKIEIEYYSMDELERLMDLFGKM